VLPSLFGQGGEAASEKDRLAVSPRFPIGELSKDWCLEPSLGGGAVFFMLRPQKAILSDINSELINVYQQVRDNPDAILRELKKQRVTKKNYYQIRKLKGGFPLKRTARFLFLNRTSFGGIYRLNRRGEFNVPYGGGKRTPSSLWKNNLLRDASNVLKRSRLLVADFEDVIERASQGDVVYCDPTYTVAHENNGFLRYNERNFSWEDQKRLSKAARRAVNRGATVIFMLASASFIGLIHRLCEFGIVW